MNVALASPLLSRFDLILVLLDTQNCEWDKIVSSFILMNETDTPVSKEKDTNLIFDVNTHKTGLHDTIWSVEAMQGYIQYVKHNFAPQFTQRATQIIQTYYQMQRVNDIQNTARTTVFLFVLKINDESLKKYLLTIN